MSKIISIIIEDSPLGQLNRAELEAELSRQIPLLYSKYNWRIREINVIPVNRSQEYLVEINRITSGNQYLLFD